MPRRRRREAADAVDLPASRCRSVRAAAAHRPPGRPRSACPAPAWPRTRATMSAATGPRCSASLPCAAMARSTAASAGLRSRCPTGCGLPSAPIEVARARGRPCADAASASNWPCRRGPSAKPRFGERDRRLEQARPGQAALLRGARPPASSPRRACPRRGRRRRPRRKAAAGRRAPGTAARRPPRAPSRGRPRPAPRGRPSAAGRRRRRCRWTAAPPAPAPSARRWRHRAPNRRPRRISRPASAASGWAAATMKRRAFQPGLGDQPVAISGCAGGARWARAGAACARRNRRRPGPPARQAAQRASTERSAGRPLTPARSPRSGPRGDRSSAVAVRPPRQAQRLTAVARRSWPAVRRA